MSASDVQAEILEPMQRLFLPPRQMAESEQAGALREYVDALSDYSGAVLRGAWRIVRDAHTNRGWPLVSAFIGACRTAAKEQAVARTWAKGQQNARALNEPWEIWKAVRSSEQAQEAARQAVAWSFKCAILDGAKPDTISITHLRIGKEKAQATARRIEKFERCLKWGSADRWLPVIEGEARRVALNGFANCARLEAETQTEIARATQ